MLGDTGEHSRTNFVAIVKRENGVRPSVACKNSMGTSLALDLPADSQKCRENLPGLGGTPLTQTAAEKT